MFHAIQTGRDPFARHTIRKRLVNGECSWCGQNAPRKGRFMCVWEYYVDADSPRNNGTIPGKFCGIECLRSYHQ